MTEVGRDQPGSPPRPDPRNVSIHSIPRVQGNGSTPLSSSPCSLTDFLSFPLKTLKERYEGWTVWSIDFSREGFSVPEEEEEREVSST